MFFLSTVPAHAPRAPDSEEPCRQRRGDAGQRRPASECGVAVSRLTAPDLPFRGREHARRTSGALAAAMPSLAPKLHSHSSPKLYHKRSAQGKLETGVFSDDTRRVGGGPSSKVIGRGMIGKGMTDMDFGFIPLPNIPLPLFFAPERSFPDSPFRGCLGQISCVGRGVGCEMLTASRLPCILSR